MRYKVLKTGIFSSCMQWGIAGLFFVSILFADTTLGMVEQPGGQVPLDISFLDDTGKQVTFKELMDGKPVILTLNYYGCPGLCTPQLNDLAQNLSKVKLTENKDYKVITLSFDPEEGPIDAAKKKANLIASMKRSYDAQAWKFLTGTKDNIHKVTESVGFHFEKQRGPDGIEEYVHPAVLVVLSPDGKITRYLNGIEQLPFDIQMALMEASKGTVRPTIAKTLLFCFAFDPKNKTYVFAAEKVGAVTLSLILFGFLGYLVVTGRKKESGENEDV
ncbi:SCO family protein [Sulfurovum sp. zt1-1]|uniref:SCO family protein n=1 Tax=Sulfurovum zhangzhouensis TaxID=3019067 RepID=A0ABT7QYJ8_9BACT|nr:SCO family protein [Sulfurovum zhangzhouensis]MDM5271913.1 SCO family protein [Sulfurovum zhangzhouensis]